MPDRPTLSQLVRAAQLAAEASAKAGVLNAKWVALFEARYGHNDISDALVEIIDYSTGSLTCITGQFIEENSKPGKS